MCGGRAGERRGVLRRPRQESGRGGGRRQAEGKVVLTRITTWHQVFGHAQRFIGAGCQTERSPRLCLDSVILPEVAASHWLVPGVGVEGPASSHASPHDVACGRRRAGHNSHALEVRMGVQSHAESGYTQRNTVQHGAVRHAGPAGLFHHHRAPVINSVSEAAHAGGPWRDTDSWHRSSRNLDFSPLTD